MKNFLSSKANYDLIKNFVPINSNFDRISTMVNCAIKGLNDPDDGSHISQLGDLSSLNTLRWIKLKMEQTEEGRRILELKPRVNETTTNFNELKDYDINSLGYNYYKYMSENNFTPNERPIAKYIPDLELAYICQRYKETHDFYHVLLGYGRTVMDEIAVKWFEGLHLRLPSSSYASLFGGLRLSFYDNLHLYSRYLPHIISNAEKSKFVLSFYYEERLKQDINLLRKKMIIIPLYKFLLI